VRIRIGNTWLAAGGLEAASEVSINGEQVVDEVAFFRALARTVYARGNRRTQISFTVEREHGSLRAAEVFLLTHYGSLPTEGDVVFVCGEGTDTQNVALLGAVLEAMPQGIYRGRSTRVTYSVAGGIPTTDSIPDDEEIDEAVTRRDTVPIDQDATEVAVVFTNPMTGTPTVVANVVAPDGAEILTCQIEKGSVSSAGFTAKLSFPAPSDAYELSYVAIL